MSIFTIFWMMIKQIVKNWKLEVVILIGLIIAVAVFSSIPLYTEASGQMALMEYWGDRGTQQRPSGVLQVVDEQWRDYHPILSDYGGWREQQDSFNQYKELDSFLQESAPRSFRTEIEYFSKMGRLKRERISPEDPDEIIGQQHADIRFISNLKDKVEIITGRWPDQDELTQDRIEVVIDERARDELDVMEGRTYLYPLRLEGEERHGYLKMEIVGVFRVKEGKYYSPGWVSRPPFPDSLFVSEDIFYQLVQRNDTQPQQYDWSWVFEHESIRVNEISRLINSLRQVETRVSGLSDTVRFTRSPVNVLGSFVPRADILNILLLVLSLPVMGMILYYILLAAGMTIRRRRNEIAMLKSRGAGIIQILIAYAMEWGILSFVAILVGPYLGLVIARMMGASAGFMQFVGRRPLPVILSPSAYHYAFIAVGIALGSCLILAFPAARHSIVTYKQNIVRGKQLPFWQRYYLDFIFLLFSLYGYRSLNQQIASLQAGGETATELVLDPLLFLVPVLFLATAALLALRILPWIIKLLVLMTRRLPDICSIMTFRQFARDPGRYSPLMFFIILTVALGIYAASIARTIDQNFLDSIMYETGADVVLYERWTHGTMMPADEFAFDTGIEASVTISEPPFYVHKEVPGINDAARVLTKNNVRFRIGGSSAGRGTVMAIDPDDFAQVTWFRNDLASDHLHDYLNRLLIYQEAALVSREFFEDNYLEYGDWVTMRIEGQEVDFFVAGVIDLWPTVYPDDFPLLVVNLDYLESQYIIEPYNVWLDLDNEARLETIVEELREEDIWVTHIEDSRTKIIEGRQEPQYMALYGKLTIGFIVAVVITVIGFFLYTFLSLKDRLLQFGVLRAIGLSVPQLIAMLTLEQLMSVGIALGLGTIFGVICSRIFLPFMQITQDIAGVVPDFLVVIKAEDIFRIFIVLGSTLLVGLIILGIVLSRMRLHQAIKLGEEI